MGLPDQVLQSLNRLPKPVKIVGVIALTALTLAGLDRLTRPEPEAAPVPPRRKTKGGKKNRIFISFAMEDAKIREFLVGQARNHKTPFAFVDMSVKEPWESQWKSQCRRKIKGCDGVIALVSKHSAGAAGQLWEIRCAREEGIPTIGIYATEHDRPQKLPEELQHLQVMDWTWDNIANFTKSPRNPI